MIWQNGEQVGAYRIEGQIGSGGMATVYRAYQPKLDRVVAIKALHAAFVQESNFLARFQREARIVGGLDHPNIIPIYDYDDDNGQPYLVMKHIEGLTLKQMLRKGVIEPAQVVQIMTQIADALTYAHQEGVLHRDVKPSNIIIDSRGIPYLTDFGLARITNAGESSMSMDTMLGTPHYISPEQGQGQDHIDSRTDVYSLGVVLYELVTGRVPFMADTSLAVVHSHIYNPPPRPSTIKPDILPAVEAVLMKALSKNPEDRYDTPTELVNAYKDAIEGSVITAPVEQIAPQSDNLSTEMDFEKGDQSASERPAGIKLQLSDNSTPLIIGNDAFVEKIEQQEENKKNKEQSEANDDAHLSPEERIRKRVEKRLKQGREEFQSLIGQVVFFMFVNFFIFNADGWINSMLETSSLQAPPFLLWFTFILWGFGIVKQTWDYWGKYGPGRERRERFIDREVARERERMYGSTYAQKAKNDDLSGQRMRLTEDGELSDSFIEEITDNDRYQHQ